MYFEQLTHDAGTLQHVKRAIAEALTVCSAARGFRCTKEWLEAQLGIPRTLLSNLPARASKVAAYLRRERLDELFRARDFSLPEREALEELAAAVSALWTGHRVRPHLWSQSVATEAGLFGVHAFLDAPCGSAARHLDKSWEVLSQQAEPSDAGFEVGAKLLLWLAYQRQLDSAKEVARTLTHWMRALPASRPRASVAAAHRALVYLCRHVELHPEKAAAHAQSARAVYEHYNNTSGQISAIRDELLARTGWSLGISAAADLEQRRGVIRLIREGRTLAGGEHPKDGLEREWFHFRLTVIECLVALGHYEEAVEQWERLFAHREIKTWARQEAPLIVRTKVDFVRPASLVAAGEHEEAGCAAGEYGTAPENKCFLDRRIRLAQFIRAIGIGDPRTAHHALITTIVYS